MGKAFYSKARYRKEWEVRQIRSLRMMVFPVQAFPNTFFLGICTGAPEYDRRRLDTNKKGLDGMCIDNKDYTAQSVELGNITVRMQMTQM